MRDASGTRLFVGDTVFIYWGNNELRRGTVQTIQGNRAKVLVDAFPTEKDDNLRYSLSKWKAGSCMIKHITSGTEYHNEVCALIDHVCGLRDEAEYMEDKIRYQNILNFWDNARKDKKVQQ
ncbi:hypothetical protein Av05_0063 [Escherichia phage Av-05]|uniref:Uncharacterized protein n=1 Tax=Escherichia phage Av-05 TaxID=1527519 RepID=A0A076G5T2_9CAUD|nr:hypothetical protein Av05_0063 [Escherichia phage Av-05]AII27606.1 hypothetical protein Av05_0063 [Escherichia phage Av-05]